MQELMLGAQVVNFEPKLMQRSTKRECVIHHISCILMKHFISL